MALRFPDNVTLTLGPDKILKDMHPRNVPPHLLAEMINGEDTATFFGISGKPAHYERRRYQDRGNWVVYVTRMYDIDPAYV